MLLHDWRWVLERTHTFWDTRLWVWRLWSSVMWCHWIDCWYLSTKVCGVTSNYFLSSASLNMVRLTMKKQNVSSMLLFIEEETFTLLVLVCYSLCIGRPLHAHVTFLGSWALMWIMTALLLVRRSNTNKGSIENCVVGYKGLYVRINVHWTDQEWSEMIFVGLG
jgi:hypothetical protein